jgi:regulatory protein
MDEGNDLKRKRAPRRQGKIPTEETLAAAALFYLGRYAASEASLRRVMLNKIRRAALTNPTFADDAALQARLRAVLETLVAKYKRLGVIDDDAFAAMKVASLRRSGGSARKIAAKLASKGVASSVVTAALDRIEEETGGTSEKAAALAFARRRALGPFRKRPKDEDPRRQRQKDLATLLRAGFSMEMARAVLGGTAVDDEDEYSKANIK